MRGLEAMFSGATNFNGRIGNWDVSGVTTLRSFLNNARNFNQDLSRWNTAKVTDFGYLFNGTSFRGDVSTWNVESATTMEYMFWDITPPVNLRGLRSTPWYNKILVAWSRQNVRLGVSLYLRDTGYSGANAYPKYSTHYDGQPRSAAEIAREKLVGYSAGQKRWNISDQGSTPVDAPGMPQNVEFSRTGDGNGSTATVTWERPITGDLIAPITYVVASTRGGFGCETTELTCTITGLPVDDRATSFHRFTVTATNAIGESDPTTALPAVNTPPIQAPVLGTPVPTEYGFTTQITNHTDLYDWSATATQGSATVSRTGLVTVGTAENPVAPDTRSTVTVVSGKFGYADQSTSVTARALKQKLVPRLGPVTRTVHGWTAEITNVDPDYAWAVGAVPNGAAEIVTESGHTTVVVTGLNDGQETTATVTTTRPGHADGVTPVTATALGAALVPEFGDVERTPDGFTVVVSNHLDAFTWATPATSAGAAAFEQSGENTLVRVTGLGADTPATLTLATSREGFRPGSDSLTARSLQAPVTFSLGSPQPTPNGFTVPITGYDADFTWRGVGDPAGSVTVEGGVATVTGLDPHTTTEITVTATRAGFTPSSQSVSGTSLEAALTPELSEPVSTPHGFTAVIDNWDGAYSWTSSTTAGDVDIVQRGDIHEIQVTGLDPADPATVTVRTTRTNHAPGVWEFTASSLRARLDPQFDPITRQDGGFQTRISNYDGDGYDPGDYRWTADSSAGTATIDEQSGVVTVTGLDDGAPATVTVTTERDGYAPGTGEVDGEALAAAQVPQFGGVERTAGGFEVEITNYDDNWQWAAHADQGDADIQTRSEAPDLRHVVVVTGLADGHDATVTVTTRRTDYLEGSDTVTGIALEQARTPELGAPRATHRSFEVTITNYDPAWQWDVHAETGSAVIRERGQAPDLTYVVVVTGLASDSSSALTVSTTRAGYRDGSTTVTGETLKTARTPEFGTPQRRDGAIRVPISNYVDDWHWSARSNVDGAPVEIITVGRDHIVEVTGLAAGQSATVTVTSSRDGWYDGSADITVAAREPSLAPAFGPVRRTAGGFEVEITNYDDNWQWAADADEGSADIQTRGEAPAVRHVVVVTGLGDGGQATATVSTNRTDYLEGGDSVTARALDAARTPELSEPTATDGGFEVEITNFNEAWQWVAESEAGSAQIETRGAEPNLRHVVAVTGLAADSETDLTVRTTRDGYRPGSATVGGAALKSARTPQLGSVTRGEGGFTVPIDNYDDGWDWSVESDTGSAELVVNPGETHVAVTGLGDGESATVTVTTTRTGWFDGTEQSTGTAWEAALTPQFGPVQRTAGGFEVEISNGDDAWQWAAQSAEGSARVESRGEAPNLRHVVVVTGLTDGQRTSVAVTSRRTDYLDGTDTVAGTALDSAYMPDLADPTATDTGFIVEITNYDNHFDWDLAVTSGSLELDPDTGIVTVDGLGVDGEADLTVTTTRTGHRAGTATITGYAFHSPLVPSLEAPVRAEGGFSAAITHYDRDFRWSAEATVGEARVKQVDDTHWVVEVTGLADGEESTVTVTTSRRWFHDGSAEVTGAALTAPLVPDLGTAVPGDRSFTVPVGNDDADFQWEVSSDVGTASLSDHVITVTGLTNGQTATVTVTTTRTGYLPGHATQTGKALETARTPQLGTVHRRDGGFTVPIDNHNPAWNWDATTTAGDAEIVVNPGESHVDVTGLADGQPATVTVTTTRPGWFDGTDTTTGAALNTELTPTFDPPVPGAHAFTVTISNYDGADYDPGDYTWEVSSDAGTAELNRDTGEITVTGLTNGQTATVTLDTIRTGYLPGTASIEGRALRTALTPDFGPVTRTPGGFTAPLTNYDPDFTWNATSTTGDAEITQIDTVWSLRVTGLGISERATATITTHQPGWFDGTTELRGRSELARLDPVLGPVVRAEGGFSAAITNYDEDYRWSAEATVGEARVTQVDDTHWVVEVTGLADGEESTVTVTAGTGSVDGSAEVTGAALTAPLVPDLGTAVPGDRSFTVPVGNDDADFQWEVSSDVGTASLSDHVITVTGLTNGQTATVTVTTTRTGYLPGHATQTGKALETARTPQLGTVHRRDGGFTVPIDNHNPAWNWDATTTAGDAEIVVNPGETHVAVTGRRRPTATVTVTTTRPADGTDTTTGAP
ncbi:MAG: BspA family leucine-rich repeat surface protein [Candidatus Nanopelagicales bacterium]